MDESRNYYEIFLDLEKLARPNKILHSYIPHGLTLRPLYAAELNRSFDGQLYKG